MDDPIRDGEGVARIVAPWRLAVRVVLAEREAPGSLHYLLEAEGFQVVGCASDEAELRRVLAQGVRADVIVLDRDISAPSAEVAVEQEPEAFVVVIWPDGVQPLSGTERIAPRLVYEELGPTIRREMRERRRQVTLIEAASLTGTAPVVVEAPSDVRRRIRRAAMRVTATTVVLLAALALTMGAAFALEAWQLRQRESILPWSRAAQAVVAAPAPVVPPVADGAISPSGGGGSANEPAHPTTPPLPSTQSRLVSRTHTTRPPSAPNSAVRGSFEHQVSE
jgi:hypothetical protein